MKLQEAIQNKPFFAQAASETQSKLLSYGMCRRYPKKEYLFHVHDAVDQLFIVVSGLAVLERVTDNSHRRAIFLLREGEILNEVVLEQSMASADCYALTELEAVCFPRALFLELMQEDFALAKAVLDSMAVKIRRLYRQLERTTKMETLDVQVSSRLWKLGRDFGVNREDYVELPFDLSITFLAGMVGSNRETVSRIIKKLSQQQLVSIREKNCRIYDMDALRNYAKEHKAQSKTK